MQNKLQDAAKIIAIAIVNHPTELKTLLTRNGINISENISPDELQIVVTTALINSQTFRNEFANWVVSTLPTYSSADGINYTFGSSISSLIGDKSLWNSNVKGLDYSIQNPETTTPALATAPLTPKKGFFSGFDLNSGLGFVKDTLNSVAEIKTASANEALANSVTNERLNAETNPDLKKSHTTLYVVLSVVVLLSIGGIYFYKKSKKSA